MTCTFVDLSCVHSDENDIKVSVASKSAVDDT